MKSENVLRRCRTYVLCIAVVLLNALILSAYAGEAFSAERPGRGLVAFDLGDRIFLSWRLKASDPAGVGFDVYKAENVNGKWTKVNDEPIVDSCNYVDDAGRSGGVYYRVRTVSGEDGGVSNSRAVKAVECGDENCYYSISIPEEDRAQKVGIADLDGDGRLDYVIKRPDFNVDPYQQPGYWKRSREPYTLEAYTREGRRLWSYDMGWAIEEGIWYSPYLVYDIDGDGCAEVYTKAGEGDPRDTDGKVTSGLEHLVVLDGKTGDVTRRIDWPSREGFARYNYYSRNMLGVAYLDGERPSLIIQRGTYRLIKTYAYDAGLNLLWKFRAEGEYADYRGQGFHGLAAADVDADGCDEIVLGSAVLDNDGTPLWTTGLGHPDVCYVADIQPNNKGLEIFYGIEPGRRSNGVCLVDARTGEILWGYDGSTKHVHNQGMIGDIHPDYAGIECYAGEKDGSNYWLYSAGGERISDESLGSLSPRAVFWTGKATKAFVVDGRLKDFDGADYGRIEGRVLAIADCVGDWREEIITSTRGEVRIYTSTTPITNRRVCLMQDRLYRTGAAMQAMGYLYPPQTSDKLR
ncbi:MAG: silent information regulator protein Sir2 [Verrucomicrobia bacterium]|nr:silent information regulator protein Sir2 [Verrucomicrobiota bacterium]